MGNEEDWQQRLDCCKIMLDDVCKQRDEENKRADKFEHLLRCSQIFGSNEKKRADAEEHNVGVLAELAEKNYLLYYKEKKRADDFAEQIDQLKLSRNSIADELEELNKNKLLDMRVSVELEKIIKELRENGK